MATRRDFVKKIGLAALLGTGYGVLGGNRVFGLTPGISKGKAVSINGMTLNTFSPHINSVFTMKPTSLGKPFDMILVQAKDLSDSLKMKNGSPTNTFSLLFRTSQPVEFISQQVQLTNANIGTFQVFMSPVLSEGMDFEVVFCNFN